MPPGRRRGLGPAHQSGRFDFTELRSGDWGVRARHGGRRYLLATLRVEAGATVERVLHAGEELVLEHEERGGFVELFRGPLEAGRVVLPVLPRGTYRVGLDGAGPAALLDPTSLAEPTWRVE